MNPPDERPQFIDIDDQLCIQCRACCAGGCVEAVSVFVEPDHGVPVLRWPREHWKLAELLDAVAGCPSGAISVTFETFRLTSEGRVPIDAAASDNKPAAQSAGETP